MNEECDKIGYDTEKSANKDLKRIKRARNRGVKPIRAYFCKACCQWHLTSKERDRSKKKKRYNRKQQQ